MKNVLNIKDCFGCSLCSIVCKHKVIDIHLNTDGFYEPISVNPELCINCGLCINVCSYIHELKESKPIHSYAAWSRDHSTRMTSTSGGVSFEVAKYLMSQGYKFCGVRYNPILGRTEHYIATDLNSLKFSKGSKYLQSFTKDAFNSINRKEKYLIVGTPCQIASFRRYIELFKCTENFILMDFFCHGIPSYLLWQKYLLKYSKMSVPPQSVSWRNKIKGWRKSYCVSLEYKKEIYRSWNDDFFTMFLGDACLGKACFDNCKFKYSNSAADIRIGDFWGNKYKTNTEGVSSVIAFSEKGNNTLKASNLEITEYDFDEVASGQMKSNPQRPWYYKYSMMGLKNKWISLKIIVIPIRLYRQLKGYITQIKKIIRL